MTKRKLMRKRERERGQSVNDYNPGVKGSRRRCGVMIYDNDGRPHSSLIDTVTVRVSSVCKV